MFESKVLRFRSNKTTMFHRSFNKTFWKFDLLLILQYFYLLAAITIWASIVQCDRFDIKAAKSSKNLEAQKLSKIVHPLPPAPPPQIISDEFSPLVTARCDRGLMYITITTQQPFFGIAHTKDFRKAPCMVMGDGSYNSTLKISLLAQPEDELYCGVQRFKGERSVSLAVRAHRSLELSEDRYFYLTCQSGYQNVRGGTYRVNLKFFDAKNDQKASRLIHGEPYILRAELQPKDSITTLRMKNCFVFTKSNDNVELIDRSGCPAITNLITEFHYNDSSTGEAYIPRMFKFPEESKVHFQCDALLCRENCDEPDCDGVLKNREYELDGYSQVSASTSAFILEPSHSDALTEGNKADLECTEWRFPWLITLCICLAIMLLTMLLLNLFMCSSLTCRCLKNEINEKEPIDYDDYDPYRADWTAPNSLHGSRYSLEQARKQYHSNDSYREDEMSNVDYQDNTKSAYDRNSYQRRSRRSIQTTSDSDSDQEHRYDTRQRENRREKQNRDYFDGYPNTEVKRY